ncbi:30S ribosomal protein S7 [Candidatus Woesearchaeota archaeon]|nr:MAG: 30S ribosomal protein S7 [Candidatus Woesearchaeota archaeon]
MKAFDKWETNGIKVSDPGLVNYINIEPKIVPKTGARYAGNRFHKSKIFIVERLINRIQVSGHKAKKHKASSGHNTGKTQNAYFLVESALELIEKKTKENPVAVLVKAIENAAPREEIITIEYGGARYPKAVEVAPQRRIDIVLKMMVQSVYQKSFNTKKSAVDALADEIINAYNLSQNSGAIQKKLELERQADSSR